MHICFLVAILLIIIERIVTRSRRNSNLYFFCDWTRCGDLYGELSSLPVLCWLMWNCRSKQEGESTCTLIALVERNLKHPQDLWVPIDMQQGCFNTL